MITKSCSLKDSSFLFACFQELVSLLAYPERDLDPPLSLLQPKSSDHYQSVMVTRLPFSLGGRGKTEVNGKRELFMETLGKKEE